jgi:hypothetical protein
LVSALGFIAYTTTGKSLGGYGSIKQTALILVVADRQYKGCLLSRGPQGFTAYDSCDRDIGTFETAAAAHEAVLRAFAA